MRIVSKSRDHFHGTHKGAVIEIDREKPSPPRGHSCRFYIRVFDDHGYRYDGWSPKGVDTMAEAKREAVRGAML